MSSRKKLAVLAAVAVLLPLSLLTFVQYRSLVELKEKTKGAYRENLRQNLFNVEQKLEGKFEDLAARSLVAVGDINLSSKDARARLEKYFSGVRESQPEIEQIFVFSCCDGSGEKEIESFGYVYSGDKLIRYEHSDLKNVSGARNILQAFNESRAARNFLGDSRRFLFRQFSCSECAANDADEHRKTYVFYPLLDNESGRQIGFAGAAVNENYIRDEMLSPVISEALNSRDSVIPNCADVVVSISGSGENGREIYTNLPGIHEYIIETDLGRPFSGWKARTGFRDFNLDSLARDGFAQGLAATVLVLMILFAGIALTVRATGREVRLAQMKSAFVSNVSHELKTPLSLISLFAEILELGRVKDETKKREYYRIIGEETRRLTKLIENILDFSKIEAGRKTYNFVSGDIGEVIESVLAGYSYQITNSGFELKTNIERNLPAVLIDRDAIAQAVLNLLDNAVKYSTRIKEISIEVKTRGSWLTIEITDCGMGIPRAEQKKIFEKFYRVGNGLVHDVKGSGLGLSLVKHIIEAHKGKITVESEAGKGSRFTLYIPLSPETVKQPVQDVRQTGEVYKVAENINH